MYLQASELFNKRITESGRTFRAKLTCEDEVIDSGFSSIGIYGGSNNGDTITIGSTISQRIEVEMLEPEVKLAGKEWKLEMGLLMGSEEETEYIPIGLFTPEKPVTDNGKTKFTAYDRMMKLSSIYTCTLSVINTISVLNDISVKTGIPIDTEGLTVLPMSLPEGYTCREVLMYIAQKYGKFANVNRKGVIQFHWWAEIEDYKITANNTSGFSHNERTFTLGHILCTTGQNEEGNVISITAGTGTQGISISNPFMTQSELDDVYNRIKGFTYTVSNVNMPIGDIRLEPWDIVEVYDTKGNAYRVPLMMLEFQYDGGVSAAFSCVGYSETESELDYKGPMKQFQERLEVAVAKIEILVAKSASIEDLEALRIRVDHITATDITTEYLEANYASIDDLLAVSAKVNRIQSDYINTINLESKVAELGYAKVDLANVTVENVGKLFADVGILNDVTIVDGNITGILNGVKINADVITAGTLSVDRLLVTGENSVVYQLNVESSGLSATELKKEVYQKYLNGTDIVANSITANQIASETITSDKLAAKAITASKIDVESLRGTTIEGLNIIGTTGEIGGFSLSAKCLRCINPQGMSEGEIKFFDIINKIFDVYERLEIGKYYTIPSEYEYMHYYALFRENLEVGMGYKDDIDSSPIYRMALPIILKNGLMMGSIDSGDGIKKYAICSQSYGYHMVLVTLDDGTQTTAVVRTLRDPDFAVGYNGEIYAKDLFDKIYPVGSIYTSVNSTNPSELFGGTWEPWGSGRVPVGVDTSDAYFNEPEKTGGSKWLQSHTHTLGNHTHSFSGSQQHRHGPGSGSWFQCGTGTGVSDGSSELSGSTNKLFGVKYSGGSAGRPTVTAYSTVTISGTTGGNNGNTSDHNQDKGDAANLQPYITCYMWKRTA